MNDPRATVTITFLVVLIAVIALISATARQSPPTAGTVIAPTATATPEPDPTPTPAATATPTPPPTQTPPTQTAGTLRIDPTALAEAITAATP